VPAPKTQIIDPGKEEPKEARASGRALAEGGLPQEFEPASADSRGEREVKRVRNMTREQGAKGRAREQTVRTKGEEQQPKQQPEAKQEPKQQQPKQQPDKKPKPVIKRITVEYFKKFSAGSNKKSWIQETLERAVKEPIMVKNLTKGQIAALISQVDKHNMTSEQKIVYNHDVKRGIVLLAPEQALKGEQKRPT
jgi:hypothetical protein